MLPCTTGAVDVAALVIAIAAALAAGASTFYAARSARAAQRSARAGEDAARTAAAADQRDAGRRDDELRQQADAALQPIRNLRVETRLELDTRYRSVALGTGWISLDGQVRLTVTNESDVPLQLEKVTVTYTDADGQQTQWSTGRPGRTVQAHTSIHETIDDIIIQFCGPDLPQNSTAHELIVAGPDHRRWRRRQDGSITELPRAA